MEKEIDIKRIKQIKGQIMDKFPFRVTCEKCGHETILESVLIEGLIQYWECDNCGIPDYGYIPETQAGMYSLRDSTLTIYNEVLSIFNEYGYPLTIRQIYYQLSSRGLVPKTENGYNSTEHHIKEMRFKGIIPYWYFSDTSRITLKQKTYNNIYQALREAHKLYRRNLWNDQEVFIQIWIEKDALRSVFAPITNHYDVPLMIARGFSSHTFLHEAAQTLNQQLAANKLVVVYHFGDYDPSGQMAAEKIKEALSILTDNRISFQSVALTKEQIKMWNLQTRPTKNSDTRSKKFNDDESCELDAIPPDRLRHLIEKCITRWIPDETLSKIKGIEDLEKKTLNDFINSWEQSKYKM